MEEITCPKCNTPFQIDDKGYSNILKQVRDDQFNLDLKERIDLLEKEKENAIKLTVANVKHSIQSEITQRDTKIVELTAKINRGEIEKKLAVSESIKKIEKERDTLASDLRTKDIEKSLLEKNITERFINKLLLKDEAIKAQADEIARLKDYRQKLSTKMIGESLERHCEAEFNKLRATGFPDAYFEKDNDTSSGTKGDYIYKEIDSEGNEIISIMFEMKNESDTTATKKANEDFFLKLDKDRKEKKCEYAVLVSLLEADNEFYNVGIADVSYKGYKKMYVIRPQFFIPIITILRNGAMNALKYKAELNLMKNQSIDISKFEEKVNEYKDYVSGKFTLASTKFANAINEIDKSIKSLEKTKAELLSSENNLRLANNATDQLSIKKLTHNNPTMKEEFKKISK